MSDPVRPADATTPRRVLVLAHTGRAEAREVALAFCRALTAHDIVVRVLAREAADLGLGDVEDPRVEVCPDDGGPHPDASAGCELAIVIGGDGTILRAAEITHASGTPVLGVNLGHVGFLAEAEYEDVASVIEAVVARRYTAEDRMTLDVRVYRGGEVVNRTFAVNDASVEKAARERMLEVVVEVDGRPLSRWGCDGVVCATPTGSTAYNFSAGGPVVWPGVEALLMVPISAHALFARPLVVAPTSVLAVEVLERTEGAGVLWCDGRRAVDLPPGARIEVRRGHAPMRIARLHEAPFTDRLVAKFGLPVEGWRGSAERRRRAVESPVAAAVQED
ncbi:NAD kinase [Nocardioides sp. TRM66260-LWL]|uniref:NAD kinase n=1 Tax=Nocardioides sp. TRM66260-LWL TaxID=2874478 RepID=UPI001CC53A9C|nr:NAD kinase [Nocardioides sp. TRM66260-LWL]MBZ5734134.1 NAD kinase [Nocardioides sp. TRM66260-LWL]